MVQNLKKLRLIKGMSQQQLADVIGVSQQSINKYENHGVEPDIATLIALATFFNTSVDYLVGHTKIDRVIEEVHSYDLNEEEAQLVEQYRQLTPRQKKSIQLVVENYIQK